MNVREKVKFALQLERLGVDVIEAGFAVSSPEDFEAVRAVAGAVEKPVVASLARMVKKDIDAAWEALQGAAHSRIHVFIATSDLHLQYKLNKTREEVLSAVSEQVAYARSLCPEVEFSAEDATRSDPCFLSQVVNAAVLAGAGIINLPDTVGYATPGEIFDLFTAVRSRLPEGVDPDKLTFSAHCHDDLGMGTACSLAAVRAGASQIECTVNGIGERAGNTALEEVVMAMDTRKAFYQAATGLNTRQLYRTSKLLSAITGIAVPPNKAIVGANAFSHESGIHQHGVMQERRTYEILSPESIGVPQSRMVLGKHSGRHAFKERLDTLGYFLSEEDLTKAFESFKELADKKKTVTDKDLEAIVSHSGAMQHHRAFHYVSFVINSGNTITSTAVVRLRVEEEEKERVATGDGPVDACFKAIDKIVKKDVHLENYTIQSVTEGMDALGEVVVQIKSGQNLITGRGLSTDIIEASVKAYLNAINKVL